MRSNQTIAQKKRRLGETFFGIGRCAAHETDPRIFDIASDTDDRSNRTTGGRLTAEEW